MDYNRKKLLASMTRAYLHAVHHVDYDFDDIYNLIDRQIPFNEKFTEFALNVKKYFETLQKAA